MNVNNDVRLWAMYYVKGLGYRSARIGGFINVNSAVNAIARRGGLGYVMNASHIVTHAVRNGRIVQV